jgi:hypothetical protein
MKNTEGQALLSDYALILLFPCILTTKLSEFSHRSAVKFCYIYKIKGHPNLLMTFRLIQIRMGLYATESETKNWVRAEFYLFRLIGSKCKQALRGLAVGHCSQSECLVRISNTILSENKLYALCCSQLYMLSC